ncbi:oleosin-like [Quercus robur]|uniref:oleosin-like n=1 Tax=Quercus robur TaxID=38942 RepID=UPI0021626C1D|nr:oleosin-like [Quercus robur]
MMEERRPHQNHSITFSNSTTSAFLRKIKDHAPTLLISGSILLLLTGLTVTATVLCIIFFSPLILFTSPIWFPIVAFLLVVTAGFMSLCGFGVALAAGLSWIYRYFRGMHPPGSDRFDNGRSLIYDTASAAQCDVRRPCRELA